MKNEIYCFRCGTTGKATSRTPGSFFIEVILYLFMIIPGLIYSFWRISGRQKACRCCGSTNVAPVNSPRALHFKTLNTKTP